MNIKHEIENITKKWESILTPNQIKVQIRKHIEHGVKNRRYSIEEVKKIYFRFFEVKKNVLKESARAISCEIYYLEGVFYFEKIDYYQYKLVVPNNTLLKKEKLAQMLLERMLYE